jgi:DNA repair protein RecO (recombination protein O)
MQWSDDGIVLGVRRHGEAGAILELMTRLHGRHLGLVHGGRSARLQAVLQPGNSVHAVWRARLDEHLGNFTIEADELRAAGFLSSPLALYGIGAAANLLRLLPERDPHPALFESLGILLGHLADRDLAPPLFVRFEIAVLAEFGFGLDIARCAVTGSHDDLTFVSPKTGRAVTAAVGEPYADRLLRLPRFLIGQAGGEGPLPEDIQAGFTLTEHFLRLHVFEPRGLPVPEERARFVALAAPRDREQRF